jgi:rhamnogalacturonyl hydrolase YesR
MRWLLLLSWLGVWAGDIPVGYGLTAHERGSGRPLTLVIGRGGKLPAGHVIWVDADLTGLKFPPEGKAYRDNPQAHAIWRFLHVVAPDRVITHPKSLILNNTKSTLGSNRNPLDAARLLERYYGHDLNEPVYIPAMALIARLRMGHLDDVQRLAEPWLEKDPLAKLTASHFSGHLLFAELAAKDPRYRELVKRAADRAIETKALHNDMSDSLFMGCPLLAKAGYFDAAVAHFRLIQSLCKRPDGLYRHSPLNDAAWGRGNAFPALGLALALSDMPPNPEMLAAYRALVTKLAEFQDPYTGMFFQVIDNPQSYREFSATAMIGRAIQIGIKRGWLDRKRFEPVVRKAWEGVSRRIGDDGSLMDVCESTGKQALASDYLTREAIWGRDPRGGGMALLFALELAQD